jgi:DivIVA domain-containing protein
MTSETMDDLVPLTDDDAPAGEFKHVLRGYDPRQVNDYLDRVEVALDEADERHAEDSRRITALEQQVGELTGRLGEAEREAAGRPPTASLLGERMATMLALAEEEAAAIRQAAAQEAEALVSAARDRAATEASERTRDLEKREREVQIAQRDAEAARLEAQKDAESVRTRASREAEREVAQAQERVTALQVEAEQAAAKQLETAHEDVRMLHEQARREAASTTAEARQQVDELSRQRDELLGQLQHLQETLAAVMSPLARAEQASQPSPPEAQSVPQGGGRPVSSPRPAATRPGSGPIGPDTR